MQWTKMMDVLNSCNAATNLKISWEDGFAFIGSVNTISESCTCELEENNPNYLEYYMCVVKIKSILQYPSDSSRYLKYAEIKEGDLYELSILNEPKKIEIVGKGVIWSK